MKSFLMKIFLFFGIASLAAAITAQEQHERTHDIFTFYHHDAGAELKPHHFILDLNCHVLPASHPTMLKFSCALESTRRVPGSGNVPVDFQIHFQSKGVTTFRNGRMIRPTILQPFTVLHSYAPRGAERVVMEVECLKIHRGWKHGQAVADISCDVLKVEAADKRGESK
ncbi:hypothetical protein BCIN_02g05060 [Botrytis cinerea B05.10]|uniref:Uncharacterized protein n=2 Tax=Botryotinia fuckeliana TaxID=40559 RepID=A0A384J9A0_BOTFB|nr:hypothetical protein BCIN_02g05060 [Botrytis cinerea B05.10]ATZ47205.1 hypothetical protein BCIN_02g05060 [Botrytis cinerea B05.10]EMR86638.1 hypothetical protein BcDW1_4789 [Botrytis cinerea BcDW1]